jgi:hypothetical protein
VPAFQSRAHKLLTIAVGKAERAREASGCDAASKEGPTNRKQIVTELLRWSAHRRPLAESCRQRLIGAFEHEGFLRSREIDSLLYLASGYLTVAQRVYDTIWKHQLETLRAVVCNLETAGIPTLIFKSAELTHAAFDSHSLGLCTDVDILVPRKSVPEARRRLFCMGFRQAHFQRETGELIDFDIEVTAKTDLTHYELPFFRLLVEIDLDEEAKAFVKEINDQPLFIVNGKAILIVEVDPHHGISREIKSEPLFERSVPSCHGVGRTFSAADHLWFNLTRLYTEVGIHGKDSFRPIAYTLPVIASDEVDWDVVSQVAAELSLGTSLYYYLQFADWLAPGHVPAELLHSLHPTRSSRLRDWGWQLNKLLDDVDPFPFEELSDRTTTAAPTLIAV